MCSCSAYPCYSADPTRGRRAAWWGSTSLTVSCLLGPARLVNRPRPARTQGVAGRAFCMRYTSVKLVIPARVSRAPLPGHARTTGWLQSCQTGGSSLPPPPAKVVCPSHTRASARRPQDARRARGACERVINVEMSKDANARFARSGNGRAVGRDNAIEIAGPYSRCRPPALRSLPERRYDPDRQRWTIPLTRAGAITILASVDDTEELVATRRARHAAERAAMPTAGTPRPNGHAARASAR